MSWELFLEKQLCPFQFCLPYRWVLTFKGKHLLFKEKTNVFVGFTVNTQASIQEVTTGALRAHTKKLLQKSPKSVRINGINSKMYQILIYTRHDRWSDCFMRTFLRNTGIENYFRLFNQFHQFQL